jgi:phospholipid/cholesterol/gamma-HCH transport system substrate-binding protein
MPERQTVTIQAPHNGKPSGTINIIRTNAIASIGTDGLVGNKVVNIISLKRSAPLAENNDILNTKKPVDTDEMLRTFYKTNNDISIIAQQLKITMTKINDSNKLWEVINNKDFANNLKSSANQINTASKQINELTTQANNIIKEINEGKGTLGLIIKDTAFSKSISNSMKSINNIAIKANELSVQIKEIMEEINHDIKNGDGIANKILKDSQIVIKINNSLSNIENGTNSFNQNMEALKHSFLFRGYFRKLEKQNAKKQ